MDTQSAAFLNAIKAINGDLAADQEKAISAGRTICSDIEQGKTADQVRANAATRLEVTDERAKQIVVAAKMTLCPTS